MGGINVNEFADIYQAVGDVVRIPFRLGRVLLVNSAGQSLMERRGRWFSFIEDIFWRGFSGEIHYGNGPWMIKASNGELVGSATSLLRPTEVSVAGQTFTFDLIKPKWWTANLILRDEQGDVLEGNYHSNEFRLLRKVEALPVAVAIYWILFRREQCS